MFPQLLMSLLMPQMQAMLIRAAQATHAERIGGGGGGGGGRAALNAVSGSGTLADL